MVQEDKLLALVKEMAKRGNLPALSQNVLEISRLTNVSESNTADLVSVLMRDCGLASCVLKTANSSYYSPVYPIKTLSSAVTFLGFDKVRSLGLGISMLKNTRESAAGAKLGRLYAICYVSANLSMALAHQGNVGNPEEVFVAGLLARLPRLALAGTFPKRYRRWEALVDKRKMTYNEATLDVFEVEYDDLCMEILDLYKIPGKVLQVIFDNGRRHKKDPVVKLVHRACEISDMLLTDKPLTSEGLDDIQKDLSALLKKKSFSLPDFISRSLERDRNLSKFMETSNGNFEKITDTLKKAGASIDISDADVATDEDDDREPDLLFGRFLTELIMCNKRKDALNQIMMFAQEALSRCFQGCQIFTAFLDRKRENIVGRFYVGNNLLISANDFKVPLSSPSPLIECLRDAKGGAWNQKDDVKLGLSAALMTRLRLRHAVFRPIKACGTQVGLYFIGRNVERSFSEREEAWLEQIVQQVETGFENNRRKQFAD